MGRWVVVLAVLHVGLVHAQEARPTATVLCDGARCSTLVDLPSKGLVDLIVVGAGAKPTIRAAGKLVAAEPCANDPKSWCATRISVNDLSVTAPATPDEPRVTPDEQVGLSRQDTALAEFKIEAGSMQATLVGPDVTLVAEETDENDPFADVVLVGNSKGYWCSGVLISPRHVLTAAHCAPSTAVGFGNAIADAKPVPVKTTTKHPSIDVAILELSVEAGIRFRDRRSHVDSRPPLGVVRILGFGVADQLHLTGFGRKRSLEIAVDGWGCSVQRARELGCDGRSEILVRGGRGNDTCLGDSGGPMFEQSLNGWRLIGITSRGTRPKKLLCGEGGIYSRVDVLATWIAEVTKP